MKEKYITFIGIIFIIILVFIISFYVGYNVGYNSALDYCADGLGNIRDCITNGINCYT